MLALPRPWLLPGLSSRQEPLPPRLIHPAHAARRPGPRPHVRSPAAANPRGRSSTGDEHMAGGARRATARILVIAALVVAAACGGGGGGDDRASAPPHRRADPDTTTTSPATEGLPPGASLVAQAVVPQVEVFAAPDPAPGDAPATVLDNPNENGAPLVFLLTGGQADDQWLSVYLPVRPNGSTGFVRADQVTVVRDDYRIEVALGAHHLAVT